MTYLQCFFRKKKLKTRNNILFVPEFNLKEALLNLLEDSIHFLILKRVLGIITNQ